MQSSHSVQFSRLFWLLPIFFWLIAVGVLIGLGGRVIESNKKGGQPGSARSIPHNTDPGFYAEYNPDSTRWLWQFINPMKTGCEKLVLRKDSPVGYDFDADIVTIDLMTYNTDDMCKLAPALASYTGSIHTDPNTTFIVNLDGKQVFP